MTDDREDTQADDSEDAQADGSEDVQGSGEDAQDGSGEDDQDDSETDTEDEAQPDVDATEGSWPAEEAAARTCHELALLGPEGSHDSTCREAEARADIGVVADESLPCGAQAAVVHVAAGIGAINDSNEAEVMHATKSSKAWSKE